MKREKKKNKYHRSYEKFYFPRRIIRADVSAGPAEER